MSKQPAIKKPTPLTSQRALIMEYMKDNHTPPTVEEVYSHVRERLPRISKKTVYANLQHLTSVGLLQEVKGVQRYDTETRMHLHAVCVKCGKVADADPGSLGEEATKRGAAFKGFTVENIAVTYYGHCEKCTGGRE